MDDVVRPSLPHPLRKPGGLAAGATLPVAVSRAVPPVCYDSAVNDADNDSVAAIRAIAARQDGLRLLVLFGSRARGEATAGSDWDLGYLGDPPLDREGLLADLVAALGTEAIDLVDLDRASGLVRFRAARDAVVVFEANDGAVAQFWFDAVSYWCDMGPIIRAGYDDILTELAR